MTLQPPSWSVLRWINLAVGLLCAAFAFTADTKWIAMADIAAAGVCFASYVWIGYIIQLQAIIELLQRQFESAIAKLE